MAQPSVVVNLTPQHQFSALHDWPETQLLLLVPRKIWARAQSYVPQFEDVKLAGRFGADPGDFEWEILPQPQGFKWWRRTTRGDASYFGVLITPNAEADMLEAYGMLDIGSDSAWWFDAIEDIGALYGRSDLIAKDEGVAVEDARLFVSLEEYRQRDMLTADLTDTEPAWRIGNKAEVLKLKEAMIGLFERARTATLAQEV
ncbi:MAG: hypothetical protein HY023_14390 [Chloroflexi bacterium]|nr:hypothetical protein [Chloroflexota bacterium]MBI3764409.1 hypothetical protein [Chloroflexota bacterium]